MINIIYSMAKYMNIPFSDIADFIHWSSRRESKKDFTWLTILGIHGQTVDWIHIISSPNHRKKTAYSWPVLEPLVRCRHKKCKVAGPLFHEHSTTWVHGTKLVEWMKNPIQALPQNDWSTAKKERKTSLSIQLFHMLCQLLTKFLKLRILLLSKKYVSAILAISGSRSSNNNEME